MSAAGSKRSNQMLPPLQGKPPSARDEVIVQIEEPAPASIKISETPKEQIIVTMEPTPAVD
jgi:hypothetical protein